MAWEVQWWGSSRQFWKPCWGRRLAKLSQAHNVCIQEWQAEMEVKSPEAIQQEALGMRTIDVTFNEDQSKISLVVVDPTLRGAILAGLKALAAKVRSGPAPPSAIEDQFEDRLEILMVQNFFKVERIANLGYDE